MIGRFEDGDHRVDVASDQWLDLVRDRGLEAVIFDCDGTLVDSAEAHFQAFVSAAGAQGCPLDRDWYLDRTGLDRRTLFRQLRAAQAPVLDVERAVADSIACFAQEVWRIRPMAEPVAFLNDLSTAGIPVAVGTNSEPEVATQSLTAIGVLPMIRALSCITNEVPPKPAPDIFQRAAGALGIPAHQILVVEDSPQGVAAAKAAGMAVMCIEDTAAAGQGA